MNGFNTFYLFAAFSLLALLVGWWLPELIELFKRFWTRWRRKR